MPPNNVILAFEELLDPPFFCENGEFLNPPTILKTRGLDVEEEKMFGNHRVLIQCYGTAMKFPNARGPKPIILLRVGIEVSAHC